MPQPLLSKDLTDFLVKIAWSGEEDKPFYKTLLVSQPIVPPITEPFWDSAVISKDELDKLMEVLENESWTEGIWIAEDTGYFVEVQLGAELWHCFLGSDAHARTKLAEIEKALAPQNRKPLVQVLIRLGVRSDQ